MDDVRFGTVDPAIHSWIEKHNLKHFDWGPESRCVYLSSDRGECFQIWVDPPASGHVSIHAADVETAGDEEFRHDWRAAVNELEGALDDAVLHVRRWMNR
jgi:hypothetical protein